MARRRAITSPSETAPRRTTRRSARRAVESIDPWDVDTVVYQSATLLHRWVMGQS